MGQPQPTFVSRSRSDWWLQAKLCRRRWERAFSWLKLIDTASLIGLGFVALFVLNGIVSAAPPLYAALEARLSGAAIPLQGLVLPIACVSVYLALSGRPFHPPIAMDSFVLWNAAQAESSLSLFTLRQTVWTQLAWGIGSLVLSGAALVVAGLFDFHLPLEPVTLVGLGLLVAVAIPGWSTTISLLGPAATQLARAMRKPIVFAIGWVGSLTAQAWDHGSGAVGSVLFLTSLCVALLPFVIVPRLKRVEADRIIKDVERHRRAGSVSDPSARRIILFPLTQNAVSRSIGRALYAQGALALAVRNLIAWNNESPLGSFLTVLGFGLFPFVLQAALAVDDFRRLALDLLYKLEDGSEPVWIGVVVGLSLAGAAIARLPRAGWRQEMRDPAFRIWPGSAFAYMMGTGLVSAVLCLLALTGLTAAIAVVGGVAHAVIFFLWGASLIPLWIMLAIHEPWFDTLPLPPELAVNPFRPSFGSQTGFQATMAYSTVPAFLLVLGLAWSGRVEAGIAISALGALACVAVVGRSVRGVWK